MGRADEALAAAVGVLEGARLDGKRVIGRRKGHVITFALRAHGWTVSAPAPPGLYVVDVMRVAARMEAPALPVDYRLGDAELDRAYVVSGVPEDLVRSLLPEAERKSIKAFQPDSLQTVDGELRLVKTYAYYYAEPEHIVAAIDLLATVVARLHEKLRDDERQDLAASHRGSPYRGEHDLDAIRTALAVRRTSVAEYLARRHALRRWRGASVGLAIALFIGAIVFALLSSP